MYAKMELNHLKNMSILELVETLGDTTQDIKNLTYNAGLLKESIRAHAIHDGEFKGITWGAKVSTCSRSSLNTKDVRKEMGDTWYTDHCSVVEYREVRLSKLDKEQTVNGIISLVSSIKH